jgi:hypothetical protein
VKPRWSAKSASPKGGSSCGSRRGIRRRPTCARRSKRRCPKGSSPTWRCSSAMRVRRPCARDRRTRIRRNASSSAQVQPGCRPRCTTAAARRCSRPSPRSAGGAAPSGAAVSRSTTRGISCFRTARSCRSCTRCSSATTSCGRSAKRGSTVTTSTPATRTRERCMASRPTSSRNAFSAPSRHARGRWRRLQPPACMTTAAPMAPRSARRGRALPRRTSRNSSTRHGAAGSRSTSRCRTTASCGACL